MNGPGNYYIKWSKSDRKRQISYDIAYMENLIKKKDTNELIYKTEADSQTKKINLWLPKRKGGERRNKLGDWD